jgi:hypothetical protein
MQVLWHWMPGRVRPVQQRRLGVVVTIRVVVTNTDEQPLQARRRERVDDEHTDGIARAAAHGCAFDRVRQWCVRGRVAGYRGNVRQLPR